jgi:hypothetical protein
VKPSPSSNPLPLTGNTKSKTSDLHRAVGNLHAALVAKEPLRISACYAELWEAHANSTPPTQATTAPSLLPQLRRLILDYHSAKANFHPRIAASLWEQVLAIAKDDSLWPKP